MAQLIDSSVWIALFLDDDVHHSKSKRFFATVSGKILLPHDVISEVATVLTYKHSKAQADQFLTFVENDTEIEWIKAETQEAVEYFKALKSRISFTDASLLYLSNAQKAKLVTYDQQLGRLAKRLGL